MVHNYLLVFWFFCLLIASFKLHFAIPLIGLGCVLILVIFMWIGYSQIDLMIEKTNFKYAKMFPYTIGILLIKFQLFYTALLGILVIPIYLLLISFNIIVFAE